MLNGNETVAHALCFLFGAGEHGVQLRSHINLPAAAASEGCLLVKLRVDCGAELIRGNTHGCHKLGVQIIRIVKKGMKNVNLPDLGIPALLGKRLRLLKGFKGFLGHFISVHKVNLLEVLFP